MAVAMVVLGPEKLPQAMRQAGKFMAEVRRWSSVVSVDLQDVLSLDTEPKPPPPTVTATPTNGDGHLPLTTSLAAVPATVTPSAPSALSPSGEWGELGPRTDEPRIHSSRPTVDDGPIPPALREGGEWSDSR